MTTTDSRTRSLTDVDVLEYHRLLTPEQQEELTEIRAALAALPETEAATITPEDLAPRIYPGLTGTVARVAVQTVAAHLRHLREG